MKRQLTAYLFGPIEFTQNPAGDWRQKLTVRLQRRGVHCIDPIKVSFLVGALQRRGLGFTRRCQCRPSDLDGLCDSLCDLDARLFGVVPPLKHERKNGLRTLVEDVEAIARAGHPHDIAHRAVLVAEARQCLVS